jgi:hypothetical protein
MGPGSARALTALRAADALVRDDSGKGSRHRPSLVNISDNRGCRSAFSPHDVPELCWISPSKFERGRRECRVLAAPMARQQIEKLAAVTTGSAKTSGIPCAMVLRLTSYSPRGTGLVCPRRQQDHLSRLDTSVGVSGPYDLVVRVSVVRPREDIARLADASIASPPHVLVTIARPSLFHRGGMTEEDHIFLKN